MSITKKEILANQKKFGLKIKSIRKSKALSQLDLASLCDVDKTSISRIENGRTNITLKTILLLSKMLEVDLKDLFDY